MRKRSTIGLATAVMFLGLALTVTYGQRPAGPAPGRRAVGKPVAAPKGLTPPGDTAARVRAERMRQVTMWRGTRIATREDAKGEGLALQRQIADQFARLDPRPAERLQHFAWCDDPEIRLNGWYGRIRDVSSIPGGGWRVEIQVAPYISSAVANVSFTRDYSVEVFEYGVGGLRFISSVKPPDATGGILFGD